MRDWADEPWVKLYTRDNADLVAMPYPARSLLWNLLRIMDRAGFLDLGRRGIEALPSILRAERYADDVLEGARYLLDVDRCIKLIDGRWLYWANYTPAQTAASSDKVRQQAKRERDRADAHAKAILAPKDQPEQLELGKAPVTEEASREDVTPERNGASRSEETRSDQKKASAAVAAPAPDPEPEPEADPAPRQEKPPAPKKRGRCLEEYDWFVAERAKFTDTRDQKPRDQVINSTLAPILDELGRPGFRKVARAYLADRDYPARASPPWPWALLISQWGRFRRLADEGQGALVPNGAHPPKTFRVVDADEDPYRAKKSV